MGSYKAILKFLSYSFLSFFDKHELLRDTKKVKYLQNFEVSSKSVTKFQSNYKKIICVGMVAKENTK